MLEVRGWPRELFLGGSCSISRRQRLSGRPTLGEASPERLRTRGKHSDACHAEGMHVKKETTASLKASVK